MMIRHLVAAIWLCLPGELASAGTYYIAPDGSDSRGDGSARRPWASIDRATRAIPDDGSTIIIRDGLYVGAQNLARHFARPCVVKAEHPYRARFRSADNSTRAFHCYGGSNVTFRGLEFFGSGGTGSEYVMHISKKETHDITFEDCIIHDSYQNDLVKVNDECHHITFRNCILYNVPNGGDEIFDINFVTDVVVEDSIMLSDMEGSGRKNENRNQALIVIKNSTGPEHKDFCKRITLRRNVFCNWQGQGDQSYVLVGEDAKDFWEAQDVTIENNLFLFNNTNKSTGAITLKCHVRNITIRANTVCGTVYGWTAYALRCSEEKPKLEMEGVYVYNNIFTDPAGKMQKLIDGRTQYVKDFKLRSNLYWNGGKAFSHVDRSLARFPADDPAAVVADPKLADPSRMIIPRWDAAKFRFLSGQETIRGEFERIVKTHGAIPAGSPAVGKADPKLMPADDILGHKRGAKPDIGAFQADGQEPTTTRDAKP
ncbi:MAG: hypothetical protein ACE15C_19125 [Phycisphaerae bacterium]